MTTKNAKTRHALTRVISVMTRDVWTNQKREQTKTFSNIPSKRSPAFRTPAGPSRAPAPDLIFLSP